jgi:hypothetical protein
MDGTPAAPGGRFTYKDGRTPGKVHSRPAAAITLTP